MEIKLCGYPLTNGKDTGVVDLRLNERCRVEVGLSTNLDTDGTVRLGVVDGLSTSLNVSADAVVVARSEGVEVAEAVESDSILRSSVADGSSVARNAALGDVVRRLSTDKEAVTANHGIGSESGSLYDVQVINMVV